MSFERSTRSSTMSSTVLPTTATEGSESSAIWVLLILGLVVTLVLGLILTLSFMARSIKLSTKKIPKTTTILCKKTAEPGNSSDKLKWMSSLLSPEPPELLVGGGGRGVGEEGDDLLSDTSRNWPFSTQYTGLRALHENLASVSSEKDRLIRKADL